MAKGRVSLEDTVDAAIHLLHKMQSEGWGMETLESEIDYAEVGKTRLPVGATVTVRLVPNR